MSAHKLFLLSNYLLIGSAAACAFLVLSLRLLPSAISLLLILLHLLTIALSLSSCSSTTASTTTSSSSPKWHVAHMAATVLTAIFQGAVALLVLSGPEDFLAKMKSYVVEENGVVILRMVGGLGVVVFVLEWVVLVLAFVVRFYGCVCATTRVQQDQVEVDVRKDNWSTFQVV